MELKVWVEGIQRIVCGVTEATTCQDVVFALAHATGKTGRFTLIERWRNNERLLAPNENPLKVRANLRFIIAFRTEKSLVQFTLNLFVSSQDSTEMGPILERRAIHPPAIRPAKSGHSSFSRSSREKSGLIATASECIAQEGQTNDRSIAGFR